MVEREFTIRITQLANGVHSYDFQVGNSLKEKYESKLVNYFDVHANVKIHKTSDFIDANITFKGKVGLNCDRCSVEYDFPIETTRRVIYSFQPNINSEEDDIVFVGPNTDYLDLSQEFYDFICLEIPQRKVPEDCPRAECPVFNLPPEEETIDPRWAKLLEIKKKF
jgi:uncharacterized metal-binding protein YceD (DUF177 family)